VVDRDHSRTTVTEPVEQDIASAQQQTSSEIRSLLWRSPLFLDLRSGMRVALYGFLLIM
jgi:hypothetical protein